MPVNTITYQPATAQLLAAYRPIVLKVQATATGGDPVPPFVVCDIYLNDVYYKSITRTAPESYTDLTSVWQFDISDALQESLQADLAVLTNNTILLAPHASGKVFCRFRASDIEDDFTVEEETKPVQATKFTDAVSGTGQQSNTFFVINSALQHEDNQNLATHLDAYKSGSWSDTAWPLSHRSKYFFCPGDSDHFPVIFTDDCVAANLILKYRLKGETEFLEAAAEDINTCDPVGYSVDVTANQVTVTLDDELEAGHAVIVQYKKQADSVWINAGQFTDQEFSFNVNGDDIAGDYDIRVIHFCSSCVSADPISDTFTLSGEVINLGWRGIHPFCVQQAFESTIYYELDVRDPSTEESFFPSEEFPLSRTLETTGQLYAKFFSDAAHLIPLVLTETDLKIYTKKIESVLETTGADSDVRTIEGVQSFEVDIAGANEVLLGEIVVESLVENYSPYPTVGSSLHQDFTYEVFPDDELSSGNTGELGFEDLQEYNTDTNVPTGEEKPNVDGDPDYIAPSNDFDTCPPGPEYSTVTYGSKLEISKVNLVYGVNSIYATTVADTESGGYSYVLAIPKNTDINVTVKARTLDGANVSGYVKARVNYIDSDGDLQVAEFSVPNNIETTLPQVFQNIVSINISNT